MSGEYRWNVADHAAGYDAAAHVIHPHYLEIQQVVLDQIARPREADFLLVDLGGGSGRLAERVLQQFSRARAVVVDQSAAFLEIAAGRMERFEGRGRCLQARLQDDWSSQLGDAPEVIVSMSAIHHLEPAEKRAVYEQCYAALEPMGLLINGDEVRPEEDDEYRAQVTAWGTHMREIAAAGRVAEVMKAVLEKWQDRNITHFDQPRKSGDDCHETIAAQLAYLCDCGFRGVSVPWQKQLWAVMQAVK